MDREKILTLILKCVVEMLPRHAADCGVHAAHPNYADEYCTCGMAKLRREIRQMLSESED